MGIWVAEAHLDKGRFRSGNEAIVLSSGMEIRGRTRLGVEEAALAEDVCSVGRADAGDGDGDGGAVSLENDSKDEES